VQIAGSAVADNAGHLYVIGYFADTVNFNPGTGFDSIAAIPEARKYFLK